MDVESILVDVNDSFYSSYENSKKITSLFAKARDGTATYLQVNEYAIEVGNLLGKAYRLNLPTQAFDYDTALKLLESPLANNYTLITRYGERIQKAMNLKEGMDLNGVIPEINADRVMGLAKAISETTDESEILDLFGEKIINFSQSIVDDMIHDNAEFASDLGFEPQIIREYEGPHNERGQMVDCEWCLNLAGVYDYKDVRSGNSDVYKRHEGCRCSLTYVTGSKSSNRMRTSGNAFIRY